MAESNHIARMHNITGQTLAEGYNFILLDATDYNTGCLCNQGNGSITPQTPGYYQVNGEVYGTDLNSYFSDFRAMIYKNGEPSSTVTAINGGGTYAGLFIGSNVSDIVECNGTTDYLQLGVFISANGGSASLTIGKATLRKIKQNMFWALFYNMAGIPIAAGMLTSVGLTLRPEVAGLAMAFSSVSVVVNSLILQKLPLNKR